jgi:hypothetical protein
MFNEVLDGSRPLGNNMRGKHPIGFNVDDVESIPLGNNNNKRGTHPVEHDCSEKKDVNIVTNEELTSLETGDLTCALSLPPSHSTAKANDGAQHRAVGFSVDDVDMLHGLLSQWGPNPNPNPTLSSS